MPKTKIIHELTNILAIALRHKIGSIVNENEIYAQKYTKDAEVLINEARKISFKANWNLSNKKRIKEELRKKLYNELEKRDFLDRRKFDIMEEHIDSVLSVLEINVEKIRKSGFGLLKGLGRFTEKERKEMWRERV